jgi:hypothetical protein
MTLEALEAAANALLHALIGNREAEIERLRSRRVTKISR